MAGTNTTTDTVLKALQDAVTGLADQLKEAQDHLAALKNDGNYVYFNSRVGILKAAGRYGVTDGAGHHYWADGNGTIWVGPDSENGWKAGTGYIESINNQIYNTDQQINDLTSNKIPAAQKALDDYNKGRLNTPESQQALASINYAAANTKYYIMVGFVLVFLVVGFVVYKAYGKKSLTPAG